MDHPKTIAFVSDMPVDEKTQYVRRVLALSVFYLECFQEQSVGDSRIPELLTPHPGFKFKEARARFLVDWYQKQDLSLTQAAMALHALLLETGRCPLPSSDISNEFAREMLAAEGLHQVVCNVDPVERAHLRLARYYSQMFSDPKSRHSRVVERFVPRAFVPLGISKARQGNGMSYGRHFEHVVPCAYLRNMSIDYVKRGVTVEVIAMMTRRCLSIVEITKCEKKALDQLPDPLLDVMPEGWNPIAGCIYERLHKKNIDFSPHPSMPCTCVFPYNLGCSSTSGPSAATDTELPACATG